MQGCGVRTYDTITRGRRTRRARYQLVEIGKGTVVRDATAGSDAGIDVVSSEYATIAAEDPALERLTQTIADQIISRLALYAMRSASAQCGMTSAAQQWPDRTCARCAFCRHSSVPPPRPFCRGTPRPYPTAGQRQGAIGSAESPRWGGSTHTSSAAL